MNRQNSLVTDQELFSCAFTHAAIGMAIVSLTGHWIKVNKSLCNLVEYSEDELLNLKFQDITHRDDLQQDLSKIDKLIKKEFDSYQIEKRYITKTGKIVWVILNVALVCSVDNVPQFFISQVQDITKLKDYEHELQKIISEDYLTKIGNRRYFFQEAEREIKRSSRRGSSTALFMIDIDHFKYINDRFGHDVGDKVLQQVALTTKETLRGTDILGRIGGEEFAALLPETDEHEAFQCAERLRTILADTSIRSINKLDVTVSIGVLVFSGDSLSLDGRLIQADKALYVAKNKGRNRTEIIVDYPDQAAEKINQAAKKFVTLNWDKRFESGNESIDSQHILLFKLANNLISTLFDSKKTYEQSYDIINQLEKHINEHTLQEEYILDKIGYSGLEDHIEIHSKLFGNYLKVKEHFISDPKKISDILNYIVIDVIYNHIIEEDIKYFHALQNHSARF